jgi:hypothetical protein
MDEQIVLCGSLIAFVPSCIYNVSTSRSKILYAWQSLLIGDLGQKMYKGQLADLLYQG